MCKKTLKLHSLDEMKDFANIVSRYPCDMDLKRGSLVVDAKSLLSLIYMGCDNKLELCVYENEYTNDLNALLNDIEPYIAAV